VYRFWHNDALLKQMKRRRRARNRRPMILRNEARRLRERVDRMHAARLVQMQEHLQVGANIMYN
jgi:hypothetical protein